MWQSQKAMLTGLGCAPCAASSRAEVFGTCMLHKETAIQSCAAADGFSLATSIPWHKWIPALMDPLSGTEAKKTVHTSPACSGTPVSNWKWGGHVGWHWFPLFPAPPGGTASPLCCGGSQLPASPLSACLPFPFITGLLRRAQDRGLYLEQKAATGESVPPFQRCTPRKPFSLLLHFAASLHARVKVSVMQLPCNHP